MRFNPVYLVLGLLSMVYAAPVDPGNELGLHSNFEKTLRARRAKDNNVVFTRFTGVHARNGNLRPPRPPPIIEMLVRQGLATHFKEEMDDPEWRIKFDNEFIPDQWTPDTHGLSLLLYIFGIGDCAHKWCQLTVEYSGPFSLSSVEASPLSFSGV